MLLRRIIIPLPILPKLPKLGEILPPLEETYVHKSGPAC